jgi:serine/threonine protein phosphatase 1
MTAIAGRSLTNPQLLHIGANQVGRDFAVGDIHGCFGALQHALESISFSADKDRLFCVGDLVDRGPESDQVLHWLDRPWFHAICGNHDFMTWRSALGDPYQDVNHLDHGGSWLHELHQDKQQLIGHRLAALPLAIEVDTPEGPVGLVHADCPYDDWQDMQDQALSANAQACCLWSQDRYLRGYAAPVRNIRAVVHGHTTVGSMQKLGNVFFIDTGGWRLGRGHFTFLDLRTLVAVRGPGPTTAVVIPRRYL